MQLDVVAMMSAIALSTAPAPVGPPAPAAGLASTPRPAETVPDVGVAEISVLTYNIHGLPWPIASGRAAALKAIGVELAALRREGRQPDIVLIQEGFRGEVADLVKASGYRYWAQGPGRFERVHGAAPAAAQGYRKIRYRRYGEGWGKFVGAGLHVLSDAPIVDVQDAPYRYCAGFDCLANKGVMMIRVALPGVPGDIEIVNTHLNSRSASRAPKLRSLQAHNLQAEQLFDFIGAHHEAEAPLLVGGDFNVKGAPERYAAIAAETRYAVVSQFCDAPASGCAGQSPGAPMKPWLRSQDLQAFSSTGPVEIRPVGVSTLFGGERGARLSDHDGYLVRYRLSWNRLTATSSRPPSTLEVRPRWRTPGIKVSLQY